MKYKLSEVFRWLRKKGQNGEVIMQLQSCIYENGVPVWEDIPVVDEEE